MKGNLPRILLTMGESAGIGPELLVKLAQHPFDAEIIVLANQALLEQQAQKLSLPVKFTSIDWELSAAQNAVGHLKIENIELPSEVTIGKLNHHNSLAVLQMLTRAGELALEQKVNAIVTAPVHKAILNQVNPKFLGHTEFFAEQAQVSKVVMMLATHRLRMALATTHIPLSEVSNRISIDLLKQVINIIDSSFKELNLNAPKIAVCGLNPHAGEDGLLGREDIETVTPAIEQLKSQGIFVNGPFPSDSLFTDSKRNQYDVFLAMYHDQGLPVVKAIGFGQCANITLGLPYIRTSVDHGTALDIAGEGNASPNSLIYATNYAIQLAKGCLPE